MCRRFDAHDNREVLFYIAVSIVMKWIIGKKWFKLCQNMMFIYNFQFLYINIFLPSISVVRISQRSHVSKKKNESQSLDRSFFRKALPKRVQNDPRLSQNVLKIWFGVKLTRNWWIFPRNIFTVFSLQYSQIFEKSFILLGKIIRIIRITFGSNRIELQKTALWNLSLTIYQNQTRWTLQPYKTDLVFKKVGKIQLR